MERSTKGIVVGVSAAFTLGVAAGGAGISTGPLGESPGTPLMIVFAAFPATLAFGSLLARLDIPELGRRARRFAFAVIAMLAAAVWIPIWPELATPTLAVALLHGLWLARWTERPRALPAMFALEARRFPAVVDAPRGPMTASTKGVILGFATLLVVAAVAAIEPRGGHPLVEAVCRYARRGYPLRVVVCVIELLPFWLGFGLLLGVAVHHVRRGSAMLGGLLTVLVTWVVALLCLAHTALVLGTVLAFIMVYVWWTSSSSVDRFDDALTARSGRAPTARRAADP